MTSIKFDVISPAQLHAAAHELGHYIAFEVAGVPVTEIHVARDGSGYVRTADITITDVAQARGVLVAIAAGYAAGMRWCQLNNTNADAGCTDDNDLLRHYHRHECVRDITEAEIRADARRLVRAHWRRINRLTPTLARRGHL